MSTHNIGLHKDLTKKILSVLIKRHQIRTLSLLLPDQSSLLDAEWTFLSKAKEPYSITVLLVTNCLADQRFSFCYIDSTLPLLPKSKISSF